MLVGIECGRFGKERTLTGVGRRCHAEIIEQVDREDGAMAWEANCGDGCKAEFERNWPVDTQAVLSRRVVVFWLW